MKAHDDRNLTPRPTEAELDILQVLWDRGASTVREVHQELYGDGAGYTTALKLLQIMHAKGLVERDVSQRAHVYRALVSKQRTQKRFLAEMVQRSVQRIAFAVGAARARWPPERFARGTSEIRALLKKIDSGEAQ